MDEEQKLIITFKSRNSAEFGIEIRGDIIANQLLALAGWFEFQGKQMMADQHLAYKIYLEEQKEKNKIVTPSSKVVVAK